MKIIQIASADLWAGAEVQLYHLACELNQQPGLELKVILLNYGKLELELKAAGVKTVVLDENHNSTWQLLNKLIKIADEFNPNVIHSHRTKEHLLAGLTAFKVRCKSGRTVHGDNEHCHSKFDLRNMMIKITDQLIAKLFQQKIIAVSQELSFKLRSQYPVSKIVTINNSINLSYIENRASEQCDTLVDSDAINISFVGRFVEVKRVFLFYQAAKQVTAQLSHKNIQFYLLGDGPLFSQLQELVEKDGLAAKIHLIGFVENSAAYLKQFDFLTFTSKHEGLPMALLEAMALKTGVISTALPSIQAVLQGDSCGYFCQSDSIEQVAKTIMRACLEPELAKLKAEKAYALFQENYSIEKNIKHYIELYKEVVQKS